jgi:acetyl esterase/lipase
MIEKLNIPYCSKFEERKMDVFIPTANIKNKALLFIHGGWWKEGTRDRWHSVAKWYCDQGYTCASIGYRFAPKYPFPSQIEDVRLAMQFFLQHANEFKFDPNKVVVLGSSAGGYLALMLGIVRNDNPYFSSIDIKMETVPQFVVAYNPISTLHMDADNVRKFVGGTEEENTEKYSMGSPIDLITGNEPPILILHGDADVVTPIQDSIAFCDRLKQLGGVGKLVTFNGIEHGFGYGFTTVAQKESIRNINHFMDLYL